MPMHPRIVSGYSIGMAVLVSFFVYVVHRSRIPFYVCPYDLTTDLKRTPSEYKNPFDSVLKETDDTNKVKS